VSASTRDFLQCMGDAQSDVMNEEKKEEKKKREALGFNHYQVFRVFDVLGSAREYYVDRTSKSRVHALAFDSGKLYIKISPALLFAR